MNPVSQLFRYVDIRLSRALRRPPGTLPVLLLWVTGKCNLACRMCGDQWRSDKQTNQHPLTIGEIGQIIAAAGRLHTMIISITGGEPLLRPDIFEILGLIKRAGISANMCTNGTLLNEERVCRLAETSLKSISISLDHSDARIHDEIRGQAGAFSSTVAGIKLLRQKLPELWININCTITRQNFHDMEKMVHLAAELKCNKISFAPVHTNLQHQLRPEEEFIDLIFSENDLPGLASEIKKCRKIAEQKGLRTLSNIFTDNIPRFYEELVRWHNCYAGYASCAISPWGDVSPCVDLESRLNVREMPLDKIWKSTEFQKLRDQVNSCTNRCWDTTNAEISIRFTADGLFSELRNILKDLRTYGK